MKRLTLLLIFLLTTGLGLHAQQEAGSLTRVLNTPVEQPRAATADSIVVPPAPPVATVHIGYLSYDSLLHQMPEYRQMQQHMQQLRQQYAAETAYNEENFKHMFTSFLQGQKDFPLPILLKRQQDLQTELEKSLAFRDRCDSLLRRAEAEMTAPLRRKLDAAIRAVGLERDYEMILNTDAQAVPFLRPASVEDATPYVRQKLQ